MKKFGAKYSVIESQAQIGVDVCKVAMGFETTTDRPPDAILCQQQILLSITSVYMLDNFLNNNKF